ncbi:cytochrome c biogenesis protein CcdA [Leptospira sp. GIMC2001]|uniref:cytochrome c biogenesis protein CcdA n=1 Tax=Leptospira sp. GIMC2001 TaxID=1513297 RepID=UPI00234A695D|nr:thioredoxin family protein [Leptospira sp. GIMC2001]WCL49182.1 thioredoxin family protein [Leptospira sp. GIMC2001]
MIRNINFVLLICIFFITIAQTDRLSAQSSGVSTPTKKEFKNYSYQGRHSSIELYATTDSYILHLKPNAGWRIFWKNPGDSGSPLKINWMQYPEGWNGNWKWPQPNRIQTNEEVNFGYKDSIYLISDSAHNNITNSEKTLSGEFRWMVCKEECETENAEITALDISKNPGMLSKLNSEISNLSHHYPIQKDPNWKFGFRTTSDKYIIELDFQNSDLDIKQSENPNIDFFPDDPGSVSAKLLNIRKVSDSVWEMDLSKPDHLESEPEILSGLLVIGDKSFDISIGKESSYFFIQAIIFAFLGGLLLNLMPCVFPILAMKAMSVVGSNNLLTKDRRKDSFFYAMGIIVFFWILFFVFAALKSGGSALGWGFQLQNPAFLFLLVLLFVFMGFQMLGWLEFSVGVSGKISQLTEKKGGSGSFFSGGLAVLVATPCTAPFMGTALAFALSESIWIGFPIFTALGLGMAIPIVVLQNSSFIAKRIPKPGPWMETFKEFLAFPLFLTAVWLLWILTGITDRNQGFFVLAGIIILVFILWAVKKVQRPAIKAILFASFLATIVSLSYDLVISHSSKQSSLSGKNLLTNPDSILNFGNSNENSEFAYGFDNATPYSKQILMSALKTKSPVFFYFTADWCVTCKYNEKTVFNLHSVKNKFLTNEVIVIKADWTNEDPAITEALESYGRNGVPLYVFFPERNRKNPKILPQILTKEILTQEMRLTQ